MEALGPALKFGLTCDLALLFGIAAWPLYVRSAHGDRRLFAVLAGLGLVLSLASFALTMSEMAGVPIGALDRETIDWIVRDTAFGAGFVVRTAALSVVLLLAIAGWTMRRGIPAMAGLALATLAWSGHAAATEGMAGTFHRVSDIVHLLAASAWIGALAMLLGMLAGEVRICEARAALTAFSSAGTAIVALIVATGLVNGWMILGPAGVPTLPHTPYGRLLIAKLLLFGVMLAMAALNRWRLTPRLTADDHIPNALRLSIGIEAGAGVLILALVAWLGALDPSAIG